MRRPLQKIRSLQYGWWVAITGSANLLVTSGPTFQGSSVLFAAIEAEFAWSRALVTGVASFSRFGGAMIGPLEGWLTDRFGPARMMLVGLTLGGIGFIYLSQVHGPVGYFLAFLLLSVGFSMGGFVPAITAVNRWLPRRRATGFALVVGGSSLGGLMVPAFAWGIDEHGWRITSMGVGVFAIAVAPIFYLVLARRSGPSSEPPVVSPAVPSAGRDIPDQAARPSGVDFTARQAVRTRAFWVISGTHALTNFSVAAISAHVFLHLRDIGLDPITASTVFPVFAATAFLFQMIGGILGDRFEKRFLASAFMIVQASAVIILAFTESYLVAIAFAITWGIGFGGRTPILHAMRGEYFGARSFGTILGLSGIMMSLAMIVAPVTLGYLFVVQGTYRWAFLGVAAACYAGAALILFATRPRHPSEQPAERPSSAPAPARVALR